MWDPVGWDPRPPYSPLDVSPTPLPIQPCPDRVGRAGADRQTAPDAAGQQNRGGQGCTAPQWGSPHYLIPFPVSRNGAGGQMAAALNLQLPKEPAGLQRDSQNPKSPKEEGETPTRIASERERKGERQERWREMG